MTTTVESALDLDQELREFADEPGLVRDLLWYLDMTTSPHGRPVSFTDRMADIRASYPPDHFVMQALGRSMRDRQAAVDRALPGSTPPSSAEAAQRCHEQDRRVRDAPVRTPLKYRCAIRVS